MTKRHLSKKKEIGGSSVKMAPPQTERDRWLFSEKGTLAKSRKKEIGGSSVKKAPRQEERDSPGRALGCAPT